MVVLTVPRAASIWAAGLGDLGERRWGCGQGLMLAGRGDGERQRHGHCRGAQPPSGGVASRTHRCAAVAHSNLDSIQSRLTHSIPSEVPVREYGSSLFDAVEEVRDTQQPGPSEKGEVSVAIGGRCDGDD